MKDIFQLTGRMELVRLAMPRRIFTLSQVKYAIDCIVCLYKNRELIGGLDFVDEPKFFGKLGTTSTWPERLAAKFREDFGDNL